jgi:hypothetical protein
MKADPKREQRLRQMRFVLEQRDTEELLSIWTTNDRAEWTDDGFDAIGQILLDRLGSLPAQGPGPVPEKRARWRPGKRFAMVVAIVAVPLLALFLWRFFPWSILSREVLQDETRTIPLIPVTDPYLLVYETDRVRVSIGYEWYRLWMEAGIQDALDDGRSPESLRKRLAQVELALRSGEVVTLDGHDDRLLIATALEAGQAAVFDKRRQVDVTTIDMRTYGVMWSPWSGEGTRSFYLPGIPLFHLRGARFFEVIDWARQSLA